MRYRYPLLVVALSLAFPVTAPAADSAGSMYMSPEQIKWMDAPPGLPKGGKVAVLQGDPSKPGPFTMRLMAPANYKIPPHWHAKDENLTVISGTLYFAEGDTLDTAHAHAMKAGAYHHLPANTHHSAWAKGSAAVVQVTGDGPFDITYVNAADDPAKAAPAAKAAAPKK